MGTKRRVIQGLPMGDQPVVEHVSAGPVVADTFAGRIHVEWDNSAPVTPLGQMPFFIAFVKQGGLFDGLVVDCPLHYTSPNAPRKREGFAAFGLAADDADRLFGPQRGDEPASLLGARCEAMGGATGSTVIAAVRPRLWSRWEERSSPGTASRRSGGPRAGRPRRATRRPCS
jgi:hypothetical protein